jgi:hypothetical protein
MSKSFGNHMKRVAFYFAILLMGTPATAQNHGRRPRILGIAGVKAAAQNRKAAEAFYAKILERDHKDLGVVNHFAMGVTDIESAMYRIPEHGLIPTEQPQIGRDGKSQLNLYDPDDTRIELMEFTPVQKPCCSEYTGAHPKP